jgi:hypothetical protein
MLLTNCKALIGLCLIVGSAVTVTGQEGRALFKLGESLHVASAPSSTCPQQRPKDDATADVPTESQARTDAGEQLSVGANLLVSSANRSLPHMEVVACANRAQPSTLLVGSMASMRGQYVTFLYRSGDGGRTWKQVLETADAGIFADPTCAFGSDGSAYYGVLSRPAGFVDMPGVPPLRVWVYTSRDSGRTWSREPAKQLGVDRPFLAVDQSGSHVYYTGLWLTESLVGADPEKSAPNDKNVETGVALFVSTDHGKTFVLKAKPREGKNGDWVYGTGNSVVTANGDVVTLLRVLKDRFSGPYAERGHAESTLSVLRTSPGGESTAPIVPIRIVRGGGFPALAVDTNNGGPFDDRVYAVTLDATSVLLFWSADEGRTWHGPTKVRAATVPSDSALEPIVFNPAVAVNRDSVVGVAWAEGTRDKSRTLHPSWVYRMAASWDGGETFSENVTVSSDRHDPSRSIEVALRANTRRDDQGRQLGAVTLDTFPETGGHTFGLTADSEGVFHAFWTDNRTGVPQVWTASVRSEGQLAGANGDVKELKAAVDTVADLTSQTAVELGEITVSPQKRQITVKVRIRNTSHGTLLAPLRVQVADVRSALGATTLLVQHQGRENSADVLHFSDVVPSGGLPSGQVTGEKTLAFKVQGNGDLRIGRNASAVLNMSFRVYGRFRSAF